MIDERMEEQASLYALDALPPDEAREFEAALAADDELQRLVFDLRGATESLAMAAPRLTPPAALKQRILAEIQRVEDQRRKIVPLAPSRASGPPLWLPWAAAACFAVLATLLWNRGQTLRTETKGLAAKIEAATQRESQTRLETAELRKQLETARTASAAIQQQLANANQRETEARQFATDLEKRVGSLTNELALLSQKYGVAQMRVALLTSLVESAPKAVAVSLWDNDRQEGVLVTENLAPLPTDKDYQLWVLDPRNPNPIDAGVFTVDAQGRVRLQFKPKGQVQVPEKFAVTIEKKGGVEKPTLPPVLIGL